MNIFGIGPVEFIIIITLGLVIFGPERLPGMGRSIGRMVARVLAWQYTSPEAQLLMEIRRDLEREITEIRDEMVRARQALDIRPDIEQTLREAQEAVRDAEVAIRAPQGATVAAAKPGAALLNKANGAHPPAEPPSDIVSPSGETLIEVEPPAPSDIVSPSGETLFKPQAAVTTSLDGPPTFSNFPEPPLLGAPAVSATAPDFADFPEPPLIGPPAPAASPPALQVSRPAETLVMAAPPAAEPVAPAPSQPIGDFDLLVMQIQALANDVASLREQLRRNGLLDDAWEPTSAMLNGQRAGDPVAMAD